MRSGHPILGSVAGLVFGLSLAVTLLVFGVLPLDSIIVAILPVAGLVLGLIWGKVAPLGGRPVLQPK